jgi:hypothetical protein
MKKDRGVSRKWGQTKARGGKSKGNKSKTRQRHTGRENNKAAQRRRGHQQHQYTATFFFLYSLAYFRFLVDYRHIYKEEPPNGILYRHSSDPTSNPNIRSNILNNRIDYLPSTAAQTHTTLVRTIARTSNDKRHTDCSRNPHKNDAHSFKVSRWLFFAMLLT